MAEDFDPDEYRRRYPDVAMSGLKPHEHYRLFGKLLNRKAPRRIPAKPVEVKPEATQPPPPPPPAEAPKSPAPVSPPPPSTLPKAAAKKKAAIVERPADFSPEDSIVHPAPPRRGIDSKGFVDLDRLIGKTPAQAEQALQSLRAMLGLGKPATDDASVGGEMLRAGAFRIDNAWVAADQMLRVIVADGSERPTGWALRAFQTSGAKTQLLQLLGPGAILPKRGPNLIEFPLSDPLMPVLFELTDEAGAVRDTALLAFPSLLPGGLHGAELRALQVAPNPMDAYWALSQLFLADLVTGSAAGRFAVSEIEGVDNNAQARRGVQAWLSAIFGFADRSGVTSRPGGGGRLTLPANAIPTIAILVAQKIGHAGNATLPFLVADAETLRPQWAVALPTSWDGASAPILDQSSPGDPTAPRIHAAVLFRDPPGPVIPKAPKQVDAEAGGGDLTIVVNATDTARTARLIDSLREVLGKIDLKVRNAAGDAAPKLDDLLTSNGWEATDASLVEIAAGSAAKHLLTIDDRIEGFDAAVLGELRRLVAMDNVASASCVLLQEASFKKQKVLQPASGGLFPASVSFAAAPMLSFAEPDVLQALPAADYPVVANTLLFTIWRAEALARLPADRQTVPAGAEDIALGLALGQAGFLNLCTTKVMARIAGPYTPRDVIDPLGESRLDVGDWQRLLERVTVLRQLF